MGIISPLKGCCEGKLDCPGKLLGMYENAFVSSLNFVALYFIFILIFFDVLFIFESPGGGGAERETEDLKQALP